jgi:hypothetical protein
MAQLHVPQQVPFSTDSSAAFFCLVIVFSLSLSALHALPKGLTYVHWKPYSDVTSLILDGQRKSGTPHQRHGQEYAVEDVE